MAKSDHPSWSPPTPRTRLLRRERHAVVLPLRTAADRYAELGCLPPEEDHPKAS